MSLHTPFHFANGVTVRNRTALAPMTNAQSKPNGELRQEEIDWLTARAQGGFGIIITCAAHVTQEGKGWEGEMGIYDDFLLPGLTKLATALKAEGALGIVQIFHGGTMSPRELTGVQPVSSSEHTLDDSRYETPRALSIAEIEDMIRKFAAAAERAHKAGFDGVEIHGANGYLITQFLSPVSNQRNDEYGGHLENRARFARRIVQECRKMVPADFIVGIRISPDSTYVKKGIVIEDSLKVAQMLKDDGADYIHLSAWNALKKCENNPDKALVTAFREQLGDDYPIMIAGKVKMVAEAEEVLSLGATFVALGVVAIGNPDWPNRALSEGEGYVPVKTPFEKDLLKEAKVSEAMWEYLVDLDRIYGGSTVRVEI